MDQIGRGWSGPVAHACAVSVVVNYEEGSEASAVEERLSAPGGRPGRHLRTAGGHARPAAGDHGRVRAVAPGSGALMDILRRVPGEGHHLRLRRGPGAQPRCGTGGTRRGHEVMGHGYRWESYYDMTREQEKERIRMCVESITRTTGQRPSAGTFAPAPSLNTRELLVEDGGFLYDCNAYNDDLPILHAGEREAVAGHPLLLERERRRLLAGRRHVQGQRTCWRT